MTSTDLLLLKRYYAALSPTTPSLIPCPPFPDARTLSLPETQSLLVGELLNDMEVTGASSAWKKVFWRRVVKGIEEGYELRRQDPAEKVTVEDEEIREEILEQVVQLLSSGVEPSAPPASSRTYYWGRLDELRSWKSVKTVEEGRMISGGTTGLRTWQACICLANHLIASPAVLATSSFVLELGAGVGLLSLVASKLSPGSEVISTDVDENVLAQLASNIDSNGLSNAVRTLRLDWEATANGETSIVDLLGDSRPSLILGADIVYDPSLTAHLAATLAVLLTPQPARGPPEALIAGTIRNEATWELFISECRSRQLIVDSVELQIPSAQSGIVGAEGWEGEGEVRLVKITSLRHQD